MILFVTFCDPSLICHLKNKKISGLNKIQKLSWMFHKKKVTLFVVRTTWDWVRWQNWLFYLKYSLFLWDTNGKELKEVMRNLQKPALSYIWHFKQYCSPCLARGCITCIENSVFCIREEVSDHVDWFGFSLNLVCRLTCL